MNDKLRQLQLCELEILNEFVRICDKFNLRYYLVGGTLLGAVRHKGFIPWDDDIDVAMPRSDYDEFAALCPTELDAQYFYQSPETDPHYFLTYAKIRKNGTEVYEERFKSAKFHRGVFIDIFPLDFCPKPGPLCHFLFNVLAVMNYRGQVDSGEEYRPYRELSGKMGYAVLRLFTPKQLQRLRKRLLRLSAQISKGDYIASYSGAYGYRKEVFPFEWYQTAGAIQFEMSNYHVPKNMESILMQEYGENYMTPKQLKSKKHISL